MADKPLTIKLSAFLQMMERLQFAKKFKLNAHFEFEFLKGLTVTPTIL